MDQIISEPAIKNMYHQSKIYKLVSNETTDVFIGSTCNSLSKRLGEYKHYYRKWVKGAYHPINYFEIVKFSDCKIILIEEFRCNNKDQMRRKEREHIENTPCINKRTRPIITDIATRAFDNDNNVSGRANVSEKFVCICGGKFSRRNKSTHEKSAKHIGYITLQTFTPDEIQDILYGFNTDDRLIVSENAKSYDYIALLNSITVSM